MEAVVCGAGIAGLSAAHFLSANGWDVTVVERAAGPRPEGYMIDFFGPGWQAAGQMGITGRIRELGYRVDRVDYVDGTGRSAAHLGSESFTKMVGDRLTSILRPDLELAIREALPAAVQLHYGTTVTGIAARAGAAGGRGGKVDVALSDGRQLTADLLVGADGIHSEIRSKVFGPESAYFRFLGFHVGAYSFRDGHLQDVPDNRYVITDTHGEAMFFYRLRDGSISVLGVHRTEQVERPADIRQEFKTRYRKLGWLCPQALEHCPEEFYYDQVAQIRMPRWSSGRVVLLGDAAGAVSLLAGQGASLAMAGAYVLADELAAHADVPSALAAFEERWRPRVAEHQKAGESAAKWFVPRTRRALLLRRLFLRLIRVPGVSRLVSGAVVGRTGAAV
ncbi:2-polyprenyl-6-methoxyphenol hydroxylase-like oxidoreductase [Arthrobacter crystallopoietes BAB-32]|uniref:2-polyprenyl-6-methoxyphenol hydroxylase-like oxidoreductase n=1 Tax=Arthrobacter crystallopoietes BAB-32 TaxID=1246476 RepID=N1V0S7_9MICC|nr:FAD-dependent oxidoreductase [Arthrobacter crystallopoietes]EMY33639.1 2-polyprenyl-6-methoxyphenol hydroxylase-like oxidoreductase [Arthrobacter crystallopoietes BAB-32]